jgi:iron complex transport system ATP-binding protein
MGRKMKTMKSLLHTGNLSVGYGRKPLMRNIELDLPAGSLTALLGINGIGKSTLIRTLAGLQPPVEGGVWLDGRNVHALSATDRARSIAVVLTGRPPTGILDVETLVGLGRQPWTDRWGRSTPKDRAAVDDALERVGALHLRHRQVATCSDGECQKVLVARALAQATPVLLLDEPTAFLDLPNRAEIVRVLRSIAHGGSKAVLFSTHDLQLAVDLCDRMLLMRSGEGPWQGTPQEAIASGELGRAFHGSGVRFDPSNGTHRFVP